MTILDFEFLEDSPEEMEIKGGFYSSKGQKGGMVKTKSSVSLVMAIGLLVDGGWEDLKEQYPQLVERNSPEEISRFLGGLFSHGGEFARLLLVLSDVMRIESTLAAKHRQALFDELGEDIPIDLHGGGQAPYPASPAWTEIPDLRLKVLDQLRRCLRWMEQVDEES